MEWQSVHVGNLGASLLKHGSWSHVLVILLPFFVGACASTGKVDEEAEKLEIQTLWPEPPEQPRYQYQTQLRSLADIRVETEEEKFRRLVTGHGISDELAYEKPSSLIARGGRIYVADPPSRSVVVFDVPRGRLFRFGVREPNVLVRPNSLAIDVKGRV